MKCKECPYCKLEKYKGNPNRYYCTHPESKKNFGNALICRTERHSEELKIKTSPKWCPARKKCRICGCTWFNACENGCYWAEDDLCSSCIQ